MTDSKAIGHLTFNEIYILGQDDRPGPSFLSRPIPPLAPMPNFHALYCSQMPDPSAMAVDGLSIPWKDHNCYMFPPLALISCCLDKLGEDSCTDSPSLTEPKLVSSAAQESDRSSCTPTSHAFRTSLLIARD